MKAIVFENSGEIDFRVTKQHNAKSSDLSD